jgi:hypothetical protein
VHLDLPVLGQVLLFLSLALTVVGARHLLNLGRTVDGKLYSFEFEMCLVGTCLLVPCDPMVLYIGCHPMSNAKVVSRCDRMRLPLLCSRTHLHTAGSSELRQQYLMSTAYDT